MQNVINRSKATRSYKVDIDGTPVKVVLAIGANEVDDVCAAALRKDPHFKAVFNRGLFQIRPCVEPVPELEFEPDDVIPDLSQLKIVEALKAIEACGDVKRLEDWLHTDPRKRVREAILSRGVSLLPAPEPETEAAAPEVFGG